MFGSKTRAILLSALLVVCLSAPAWAYTLQLQYFDDSNVADAYARRTGCSDVTQVEPGAAKAKGVVPQSASTGESPNAIAKGESTVSQAVVMADQVDATQSIIHVFAAAGHTDTNYYEGYGQGYGDSFFAFVIVPGPGEQPQVYATIGFSVSGSLNLKKAEPFNMVVLEYGGVLKYFDAGSDLQVAGEKRTWQGSIISSEDENGKYGNGQAVTLLLETNKLYFFEGFMQVDAQAYGFGFNEENNIGFDAFVSINNIQAVPVPAGIVLLGSGLALLGLSSLRRRG